MTCYFSITKYWLYKSFWEYRTSLLLFHHHYAVPAYIDICLCCYTEGEHAPCMHAVTKHWTAGKKPHVLKICLAVPWVQGTHKMASAIENSIMWQREHCTSWTTQYHYHVWIDYSGWIECLNANPMHSILLLVQNGKTRSWKCQLLRIQ